MVSKQDDDTLISSFRVSQLADEKSLLNQEKEKRSLDSPPVGGSLLPTAGKRDDGQKERKEISLDPTLYRGRPTFLPTAGRRDDGQGEKVG